MWSWGSGGSRSSRSDDDTKKFKEGYPSEKLDDLEKDLNWAFYSNKIPSGGLGSHGGATIEDAHKTWWGDYDKLESKHDYIQWLFPIHESSAFNSSSQALQRHEVRKIRRSPVVTARFLKSYELILDFFGFVIADKLTGRLARKQVDALGRLANLNTHSHNFLRITRILKCLNEMGFVHYQLPFLKALAQEIYVHKTLRNALSGFRDYWKKTLVRDEDAYELALILEPLEEAEKSGVVETCDFAVGERVKALFEGTWYPGTFARYHSARVGGTQPYGVQCDADKKGIITWVPQKMIATIEVKTEDAVKKSKPKKKKPQKTWSDGAEAFRRRSLVNILAKKSCRDLPPAGKVAISSERRLPSAIWFGIFTEYLETWFLKTQCEIRFMNICGPTASTKAFVEWEDKQQKSLAITSDAGSLPAAQAFCLKMVFGEKPPVSGWVGLYKVGQLDEVIKHRYLPVKGSKGVLEWKVEQGPWDSGMYEFRYFNAGYRKTEGLLFVPSRGPIAVSNAFPISGVVDPSKVKPEPKPLPEPKDEDLASKRKKAPRSYYGGGSSYYSRNNTPITNVLVTSKKQEVKAGLYRDITRVKVLYQKQWYEGVFIRADFNGRKRRTPYAVQCDADPKGTLTWVSLTDLEKVEKQPEADTDAADDAPSDHIVV